MPEKDYQRMSFEEFYSRVNRASGELIESGGSRGLADLVNECRVAGVVRKHIEGMPYPDIFYLYLIGRAAHIDNAPIAAYFRPREGSEGQRLESALRAAETANLRVRILGRYSPNMMFRIDEFSLLDSAEAQRFRGKHYQE